MGDTLRMVASRSPRQAHRSQPTGRLVAGRPGGVGMKGDCTVIRARPATGPPRWAA
jgi:hypothetical protein